MRQFLRAGAFVAAMVTATGAFAASALVTTDLNLRTGPGSGYARITTMPDGAIVDVRGCTSGYSWCRVDWNGYDGWAYSDYLAAQSNRRRTYDSYGASIGIPLIAGAIIGGALNNDDHRDHGRRYDRRDHHGHSRYGRAERRHEHRVEKRQERRAERRQERRAEKRQERRAEKRQERRAEKRQERRKDRRAERREKRQDRRAERRDKRQERRAERRDNGRAERRDNGRAERRDNGRAERRDNGRAVDRCPGGYRRHHGNC